MKRAAFVLVLLALAVGALPAGAGEERDLLVRHGEGIGKLRLGMTMREVKRVLGSDATVYRKERRTNGYLYLELGWDYGWWTVGFMRPPRGRYEAVRIGTVSRAQRTPEGLGADSTDRALYGKLRGVFCRFVTTRTWKFMHSECVYRRPTGRQTVFVLSSSGHPDDPPDVARVAQTEVRSLLFYRGWRVRFILH
jgi:hypothetical protein